MKINKFITIILIIILLPVSMWGQAGKVTVKGNVSDASGPLPGATVYQDGKMSNGILTGPDGGYTIMVDPDATLIVSCLGYAEIKEKVSGRTRIDFKMKESYETLAASEVVSVGYGSVARRDLTGSVGKVNMDDISKSTPMNFDQALAGRVAGVVVSTSDGSVGSEANIIIRGNNSLTQSSAPLYVIDGFPTESSFASSISPADIESIDVLKDASASAIYGARGANGVIIITTKKGSQGKPTVNFSASWTGSKIANKVDLLNGYDYVRLDDEFYMNRSSSHTNYFTNYLEDGTPDSRYFSLEDYASVPYVDWQDYVYRNALSQNYNISLSGGNSKTGTSYNVSFSALDQNGILVKSNFNRYSGSIKLSQKVGEKVTVDFSANYSQANTNGIQPATSNSNSTASTYFLYSVWGFRPLKPLRDGVVGESFINQLVDEEVSNPNDFRFNPMANVKNSYRKVIRNYLNSNVALNWDIIKGLRLRVTGGYNQSRTRNESFNNSQTMTGHPASPLGKGPNGFIYNTDVTSWLNENTLNYDTVFGIDHNFQALVGFTVQGETSRFTGVEANHVQSELLGVEGLNTGEYQAVTPYKRDWLLLSGLARLNYNYAHKYYVTASLRADGSSKFPSGNRWGVFPSGSIAWSFSNEDWAQNNGWFNTGKIRASWGMTGNNRTQTPYDYYSRFVTSPGYNSLDYVRDGKTVSGYFRENMENPFLGWETTAQTDIGLDLAFLHSRISLTADIYQKNTYDLLLQATMPASSGYESAMINVGSMRNRGIELSITAIPVQTKNFTWTSTLNFGMNNNTVTALANNQTTLISTIDWNSRYSSQTPYVTKVGMPTGLMYGYRYVGTYKYDEFTNGTLLKDGIPYFGVRENIRPGDPKYEDVNGDGIINDSDRTVIGIGQPLHTGGWNNTFNFYGVDLSIFMNWSYGNDLLNANRLVFEYYDGTQLNQFGTMRNAWSLERNPDSDVPRSGATGMEFYSSRVVEDGSFLRIKTVTVGYTFPSKWMRKMKVQSLRVYLTAENLFTFTNYSGPDPEVSTRNSVLTPGFDWSAYPRARSLTGGISFSF